MNYEFSKREKTLLVILCVLLICIGYFKLVLEPINAQIDAYRADALTEQAEIDRNAVLLGKIRTMQKALEEIRAKGECRPIPDYDNSGALMLELHSTLARAREYSLEFGAVTQNDYIISRPVTMSFRTDDYRSARSILTALHDSDSVNRLSDLRIETVREGEADSVSVFLTITYYEIAS